MSDKPIAQAYVQIMPSMEGISGQLSGAFSSEVNKAAKESEGGFSVIKGALANLAAQGISAAVSGVKNLASSVTETGKSFEASMSQVAATMGVPVSEIQDLTAFAKEMGAATAFSATEAADALNYMALAGYDSETSMKMLPNVLNLAAAGGIDLASASDMVTDAQSALGLTLDETSSMVDQMAAASSKSNTSVAQLGEAFLKIGATARNVAGGTQELSTVLGVLADNGIKGSEGGTHLRNILLSLQSAAENGAVSFGDYSVSVYDADGNMRSMIDIIGDMQQGMQGMTQESKDAMISGVFNKTDLAAVNALLGTSSERFDELSLAIGDAAGAAGQMADTQLDNLQGRLTLMSSAWEGFQLQLYDTVSGPMQAVVETITNELIPGLSDLVNGVEGAGEEIGAAVGNIISTVIETVSSLLPEIIGAVVALLESVISSLVEHAPQIVDTVMATIPTIISSVLGLLPDILSAVLQIITAILGGLADNLPDIVQAVVDIIPVLIDELIACIPDLLDAAIQLLMAIVDAIPTIVESLLENMPHIIETILNSVLDSIPQLLEAAISLLMMLVEAIPTIIQALIDNLPSIISTIITTLLDHLPDLLDAAITLLFAIIDAIPTIIRTLVVELPNIVSTIVSTLLDHLPELIVGAVQLFMGIIEAIPQILIEIGKNMPQIIEAVVSGLINGFGQIVSVGYQLIQGLWEGIKSAAGWLWDKLAEWARGIVDGIKNLFGIHSPSKVFAEFGSMLSAGLGEGIEESADSAIGPALSMARDVNSAISDQLNTNYSVDVAGNGAAGTPVYETISNAIEVLTELLNRYLPVIAEDKNVYIDGATMVGAISGQMYTALDNISNKKARGVL